MANIRTIFTLVDNISPGLRNINQNLGTTTTKLLGVQAAITIFETMSRLVGRLASQVRELTDTYASQYESEVKLYTIMRQRMNASEEDFNAIKNLARETEKYGVLKDRVILKGAQELASFVNTRQEIEKLLPAIANLVVQQNGYNATADQMRQITTSIGKMLNGTVSGLSKLGLAFTDSEKKMLKSNDMAAKVNLIYGKINEKVGDMNRAMGLTNLGAIMNLQNRIESVNEELGRLMQPLRIVGLQIKLAFKTFVLEKFSKLLEWINKNAKTISNALLYFGGVVMVLLIKKLAMASFHLSSIIIKQAIIHWKVTLIIAAIFGIFVLLNKLGIPIDKIFAKLINGIARIFTHIRNAFATVYNIVVVPIYNIIASIVEKIKAIVAFIKGDYSKGDWKVERLNKIEIKNASEAGKNAENKTLEATSKLSEYIQNATSGFQEGMPGVKVLDGAMAVYDKDLIDIADDYRDLLSKRAVEKFNLQLARIAPSVTIEKVDVHKEADASNVLDTVVNAIETFSNSSLSSARSGGGSAW